MQLEKVFLCLNHRPKCSQCLQKKLCVQPTELSLGCPYLPSFILIIRHHFTQAVSVRLMALVLFSHDISIFPTVIAPLPPQGWACNEDSSVCVVCWSLTEQMNELGKQEKKEIPIKVPTKDHAQPCSLMALLEARDWHIIPICLWLWFLPDSGLFLQWRQLQSWTESRQHSEELGVATCYSKGDLRHRPLY